MDDGYLLDSKQQFDQELLDINELLNSNSIHEAFEKYIELIEKIETEEYVKNHKLKANIYVSFAYFLFGISEYEYFIKMLIKAQEYGYSREEIDKVLNEAFIEPNLHEFKTTYDANIQFLLSRKYIDKSSFGFQELPYRLLPTGVVNEYYMYDKEKMLIMDKISLYTYQNKQLPPASDALADYLLLENWSTDNILTHTNAIKKMNKKTYIIVNNIGKFLSCLQGALLNDAIISNVLIFDSLSNMNAYFKSCNAFLPRNIINLGEKSEQAQRNIDEIHNDRICKKYRNGDQILLSVCIPSYNRGQRAYDNVIHLLQSYYDEEIEFILSNNGTQNETKEWYDKINEMDDARLTYFAFEDNQGFPLNFCKVSEMARGKFILFISDEDLVDLNVLDKIMNMLNQSTETLAIMRTSTSTQSKPPSIYANSGKDAMLNFMLTSNYMSGIILNNGLLKQHKGIHYIQENQDNSICSYYPHMYLELLLCQYGNVQGTELILINEGAAEKTEVVETEIQNSEIILPYYASIEGRLEQHEGFSNIFKDLEICSNNLDLSREMYIKLCAKTFGLVGLSINVYYSKTDTNLLELLDRVYNFCVRTEIYKININNNRNNYRRDLEVITKNYEQLKAHLRISNVK